jgi:hypothetical protein
MKEACSASKNRKPNVEVMFNKGCPGSLMPLSRNLLEHALSIAQKANDAIRCSENHLLLLLKHLWLMLSAQTMTIHRTLIMFKCVM